MESNARLWVQLCGVRMDGEEERWDYLLQDGQPIFDSGVVDEEVAWRMANTVWLLNKYTMSVYMHRLHPEYEEIDINYSITDGEWGYPIGDEGFTEILWIDE